MTPEGVLNQVLSLDSTDGEVPRSGMVLGTDNYSYGVTDAGGKNGWGTVFKLSSAGVLTILHDFNGTDGAFPVGPLVLGTDGNFYGTTEGILGPGPPGDMWGTVFKITPGGILKTLLRFDGTNGAGGSNGGLVRGLDGNLYGTTVLGGLTSGECSSLSYPGCGEVFRITPTGTLKVLYKFTGLSDGQNPAGGLIQGTDGNFYGTTSFGGSAGRGTVFRITPGGTLKTYDLPFPLALPIAPLVQGTDGYFYGTTAGSITVGSATVFQFTPADGAVRPLHLFPIVPTSAGGLVQHTDGRFYGTTPVGGTSTNCFDGCGTVFSLDMGLGPFIKTVTASGKVGSVVQILGTGLTGATKVTFHGTAATFRVLSDSFMTAMVPAGSTTGWVNVSTSRGTLRSNVIFQVTPSISSFSPAAGPVGTRVTITGESFTGATLVTFESVKATSFTVDSYTQITATVPAGAKTGKIEVTTPGGTATSAGTFTVN
jgi:uncharacterized repeat protein (TIGR03803 family)